MGKITGSIEVTAEVYVSDVVAELSVEDLLSELQNRNSELTSELMNIYGFDWAPETAQETSAIDDHLWNMRLLKGTNNEPKLVQDVPLA